MKDIEIRDYMDKKFKEMNKKTSAGKRWLGTIAVSIVLALIVSGFTWSKAIGSLETKTEILWKEYVPGDLFMAIIHSYDLQNKYIMGLLNGDQAQAEKAINEFIEFRNQMYNKRFSTRGVTPMDGRSYKPVKQ